ncbi:hypothetical protein GTR02_14855 [Kineococcus sp. R8]|uniref:hypothetical protein n=1 Tax=Kineococcus siccus TaxID=2696567 RepID=UPI001412B003|nr:hypothetical protein [Kineococcus siccus]NAZ83097.1 hypothetical protein [Kineococcus siccus]
MTRPDDLAGAGRRRTGWRAGAGLAAGAVLLAGCAAVPPVPAPATPSATPVVVEPAQAARIVTAASDALRAADTAGDPALLAQRVTGPEKDLRTAAFAVRAKGAQPAGTGAADELDPLTSMLPRQEGWPRFFLTVTDPGADEKPSLVVLRSDSAREPYRIWGTPSLLPGVSLPAVDAPSAGVEVVAPDEDTNLVAAPQAVADRYADVLTKGGASGFAAQFADDPYRSEVTASVAAQTAALSASGGTLTQQHTVQPGSVIAVRTRDGGALVVAALRWESTSTGPAGGRSGTLDPVLAALAGRERATSATVVREEVLAFAVPPTDGGPVRVLAAESGPVSVTAA